MNITKLICMLAIGALITVSCTLEPEAGSGSGGNLFLTLAGQAKGPEETARIYLITADDDLVPIGADTDYRDVNIAEGQTTVTISGLPVGPEYQVFFALGEQETGYFSVSRYAVSAAFELSPGDNVSVPKLTLLSNPVNNSDQIMGKNLKGVVVDGGGDIFSPSASTLYKGDAIDTMTTTYVIPSGHSANSISIGANIGGAGSEVWVNTNRGILPYNGGAGFDEDFSVDLGVVSILDSGAYNNGADFLFFQRDGGLGGIEVTTTPPAGTWINVDISDVITGQPIKDLVVKDTGATSVAYFASKLGTFSLNSSIFTDGSDDFLDAQYSNFIEVGPNNAPVIAMAYDDVAGKFILGTEEGVWTSTDPSAGSTLVSGTRSKRFTLVAVATTGRWAALSDHWLYIDGADDPYPFHAGFPGTITGMAWQNANSLVIAGTEGLVELSVP